MNLFAYLLPTPGLLPSVVPLFLWSATAIVQPVASTTEKLPLPTLPKRIEFDGMRTPRRDVDRTEVGGRKIFLSERVELAPGTVTRQPATASGRGK